jgi:dipeptidyl aminopeptidase/acylaminoacyl peptidase|tara:strand:+ start:291 stop:2900 length:2610 start_codon:yes stop_codon:yes gene_type:complete
VAIVTVAGVALSAQSVSEVTQPQGARVTTADYRLAARFAPYKMRRLTYSTTVEPRWIEGSDQFWYEWETSDGKSFYLVDPATRTKRLIFDNDRIAAELTRITQDPWDGRHLPIQSIKFIDVNTLQFEVESSQDEERDEVEEQVEEEQQEEDDQKDQRRRAKKRVFHFEYDVQTRTLRQLEDWEAPDDHPEWASVSPDDQIVVFARHDNLYTMSGEDYEKILDARRGKDDDETDETDEISEADEAEQSVEVDETALTTDGEVHYSYAVRERGDTDPEREKNKDRRKPADVTWSNDSKRIAIVRNDRRESGDLWVVHSVGNERPELETYKYDLPGEEHVAQSEILLYDFSTSNMVEVHADRFKDERLFVFDARQFIYPDSDRPRRDLWLSDDSDLFYFWRRSRDQHKVDVGVADAVTGEVRPLIEERLNTYIETKRLDRLASGDMLWWSERDGWAHLYRFGADGALKNRLTEGPFSVREVVGIDEASGVVFFVANGREPEEDPYYRHLYRVNLDGSDLQLLSPGDFDHQVVMGESSRFFVDNYSRVDTTPASALYDASGDKVMDLEEADFSKLEEAGYDFPIPYTVKAADGVTDLYGVMYKPFNFDPNKRYPIIAFVYPGPQTESVAKAFASRPSEVALSQFGFIVITVGNRGGHPARSKWYHNYGYGNLRDYGLADKKAAIEQLADRHVFIDIDRVGIYGHSGGGFMSTAAMLVYPDFFKVAVSSSGNHNNDVYNQNWSEKHHGVQEVEDDDGNITFEYDIEKNSELAKNLKGHLLLTTGDIDNNVHPAGTLRMVEALIRANKRFDFFMFPGQRHAYGDMGDYWFWLRAEYFVKHLLGDRTWSPSIMELDLEQEQTGGGGEGSRRSDTLR